MAKWKPDPTKLLDPSWGQRLTEHTRHMGLSQYAIAERLGMSQGIVSMWVLGKRDISLKDFFRLCEATVADPQFILFGGKDKAMLERAEKVLNLIQNPKYFSALEKMSLADKKQPAKK